MVEAEVFLPVNQMPFRIVARVVMILPHGPDELAPFRPSGVNAGRSEELDGLESVRSEELWVLGKLGLAKVEPEVPHVEG